MGAAKFILSDEDFQTEVREQFAEIKKLLQYNLPASNTGLENELFDTADAINYLKVTRRTLYAMRIKGLPFTKSGTGKIFFWKNDLDKYLGKQT